MRAIALLLYFQMRNSARLIVTDPRKLVPLLLIVALYVYGRFHKVNLGLPFGLSAYTPSIAEILANCRALTLIILSFPCFSLITSGFSGSYLAYSAPDLDYLMASPIARRTVLALKSVRLLGQSAATAFLLWLPFIWLTRPFFPAALSISGQTNLSFLVVFFVTAACAQLGLAISAHTGIRKPVYAWLQFTMFLAFIGVALIGRDLGLSRWAAAVNSPAVTTLLLPFHWATDALVLPLAGQSGLEDIVLTATFFICAFASVFAKTANFYETAFYVTHDMEQLKEAGARTAGVAENTALFAQKFDEASEAAAGRADRRPYTIPAFGSGAVAVLWANLVCAAKRPWLNIIGPIAFGLFLGGITIWQPDSAPTLSLVVTLTIAIFVWSGGIFAFLPAFARRGINSTLPIAPWKIACADIVSFGLIACLPVLTLAAVLAVGQVPGTQSLVPVLATYAPLVVIGASAAPYCVLGLMSSSRQDPLAFTLVQFVLYIVGGIVIALYIPMMAAPAPGGYSGLLAAILALPGCALVTAAMIALAGRSYAQLAEEGESLSILAGLNKLAASARREPDLDEAAWLLILLMAAGFYDVVWIQSYGFLVLVAANEGLYLGSTVAFSWFGRYDWPKVLHWRSANVSNLVGGMIMGLGIVPWVVAINLMVAQVWHGGLPNYQAVLYYMAKALSAHPIITPIVAGCLAGFCEELAFRGPIQTALVRRFGPICGIGMSAFLFAAWHLDYFGLLFRTVIGAMLGWIVWRGKSIFPAMVAHAAIDTSVFGYYSWLLYTKGPAALQRAQSLPHDLRLEFVGALCLGAILLAAGSWLVNRQPHRPLAGASRAAETSPSIG